MAPQEKAAWTICQGTFILTVVFLVSITDWSNQAAPIREETTTKAVDNQVTLSPEMQLSPSAIAVGNGVHKDKSWPAACFKEGPQPLLTVFPNSSPARTLHMSALIDRIGGCALVVPAVMRDNVTSAKVN